MGIQTISLIGLIEELEKLKNEYGNMPVIHQSDPEGNSFGTIQPASMYVEDGMLFIHPFEENIF